MTFLKRPRWWGLLFLIGMAAYATEPTGYYRFPTVYGNKVVFTTEGDLWEAPLAGGAARRLTIAAGVESFALYSPDGKWIAFTGNYDGNLDVYVMTATGGEPKRLTWHPAADVVAAWSPDGQVVYRSMMDNGIYVFQCYKISPDGGYPEKLPIDWVSHLSFEPKGDRVAYTQFSLGTRTWKRYKGGWAEQIWVGSLKTHDYQKVTTWEGNNATPMWYKDRVYFMRDNDARMNVHSMKPDGSDIQQHTNHTDWDARWPTLSDGKIAYSLGADIWVYDIDKNESKKLDISLPSDRIQTRDKFVSPEDYTGDFALSADGKRLLLGARGELFSASTERRSVIHQITRSNGAREKGPSYMPKGEQVLTWSDMTGEEALYLYDVKNPDKPKKVCDGKGGWNFAPSVSPDGKSAVYGDNNRKLWLVSIPDGSHTQIDTSGWEMRSYEWSPDSRYVAYDIVQQSGYSQVKVYDVKEQKIHTVTDPLFSSYSPTWDPKGKWLYFISSRFMNPHSSANDWSFIIEDADRVYGLALAADTKSPYQYSDDMIDGEKKDDDEKDDDKADKDDDGKDDKNGKQDKKDKKDKKDDEKKEEKVEVKIDWDGLEDRIVEFPVDAGNFFGLAAIEGKFYYVSVPSDGWRDGGGDDDHADDKRGAVLHLFDIKKKKDSSVSKGVRGYAMSEDHKKIVVRKKSGFVVMDAGDKKEPEADEDDKDAGLHLDDWTYDVDPRVEWNQIFNEAWRLQRDFFYDPGMHGINWKAQKEHYGTLLSRISTRDELNDVIAQMISELNAGHAYVGGGDQQGGKSVGVGLLGVDVTRTSDGFYRIDRIITADRWDTKNTSPLGWPGLNVKEGDYLVAIDGRPTNSVQNYLELLNNKSGKLVIVSTNDKPSLDGAKQHVVKPLGSEYELRYWDWVYSRAEYVRKAAGDEIAYVHLSDMGLDGMIQWMREYYPQAKRKGLIMDVRYNGGGNIARWILSQLEHTVWTWGLARNGSLDYSPDRAFYGHMIALCNEETGSDGETFSEGWKRLKMGPLVGMRTWGGWVGIRGDKPLMDRGFLTQPEFTGWGKESKWLIEGPGVTPDLELKNSPKKMLEGVDEQLDYAISYLKKKIKDEPLDWPTMPPFPNKAPTGYKK
ncbi:PDZ domain-containing protein [candidate division KSB1 bacterium]|nr:PDZ domain-containing protein [candidate division KSB1 bacterium]